MQTPRALDAESDAYINSEGLIPVETPCRISGGATMRERRDRGTEVRLLAEECNLLKIPYPRRPRSSGRQNVTPPTQCTTLNSRVS